MTFAFTAKVTEIFIPPEYWFTSGWVVGLVVAMIYKSISTPTTKL